MSKLSKTKILDYVSSYGDGIHGTPIYDSEGKYFFINGNNLKDGNIEIYPDTKKINEIEFDRIKRNLSERTILVSINGSLGNIAFYKGEPVALGKSACFLNIKINKNLYFCKYVLETKLFKNYISLVSTGSTIKNLSPSQVVDYEFWAPSEEQQEKISNVLRNIDLKIQNNKKQIENLESLAKTIYDYWFVQFDFPNEEGKPYKSSGGKMVWNEELKREIPEGWKYTFIGSITNCYDSKRVPLSSKQRGAKKGEFPYYGATCVMDYVNEFIFDGDYVLMAEDGSIMKGDNTPILQRITGKTWVNNHAHILEPKKGYSCAVLMQLLKDIYVPSLKTGSIQAKITQEKMNSIKIIDIPSDLLYEINKQLLPLDSKVLHLQNEISVLNKLKGFILPLLMNGQVKIEQ
ncbi:restriction endonuclease subunit S [Succinivibrio faecicola]|uniref:Restriction endonuclease subunit S n=1 Tax=Succinivibrio faecicola TaxID=2820300 RepID=A0ABS7DI63_9GAMM|nr:restriction endonuclease subunit S [Succinivibrio faecicola]MBW7570779.1 restriction endonuclease subunit S [Succinivibrio faecicola]